ncbi:MAG: transcriptional regulator [Halomonas sp.]|nr:transcriptional regulator [Halomonas sp.]
MSRKIQKILFRQKTLMEMLDLSSSGFYELRKRDPSFPKPIKDGNSQQAPAFYVYEEVRCWLIDRMNARDKQDS